MKKIVGFLLVLFISCGVLLTAEEVRKANPANDFKYDLTEDNAGVVIKGYKGEASGCNYSCHHQDFSSCGDW